MENRIFIPGSEWAYFKLYTGTKTADTILKNELLAYIGKMQQNSTIDKWFFIRYSDPDFHIRLRLHLNSTRDFSFLFNQFFNFFNPIVDTGLVWRIQCDTYQREMERYGSNTIFIVEDIFYADSENILRLLQLLDGENPDQERWKLALLIVDLYFSAFKLDMQQRKKISKSNADGLKKEFGFIHHQTTKQLNDKCRTYRKDIENTILTKNRVFKSTYVTNTFLSKLGSLAEELILLEKSNKLQVSIDSLITNLIHMSLVRWFRSKNRLQEMVIYEFLSRYYASEIAKQKLKPL